MTKWTHGYRDACDTFRSHVNTLQCHAKEIEHGTQGKAISPSLSETKTVTDAEDNH